MCRAACATKKVTRSIFVDVPEDFASHVAHQSGEYADLCRTNIHIWRTAGKECDKVLIFESDAKPSASFLERLKNLPSRDITWLDSRGDPTMHGPSGCCSVGMLYSKRILPQLVADFSPLNPVAYANNYFPRPLVNHNDCIYDWYLGNLAAHRKISSASFNLLYHA